MSALKPNTEPLTVSVEQAGRLLGISRGTAFRLANAGEIPAIRLGHRLLVPRKALDRLLAGETAGEEVAA